MSKPICSVLLSLVLLSLVCTPNATAARKRVEVFQLQNVSSEIAMKVVQQFFEQFKLKMAVDPKTNSIVVFSDEGEMVQIRKLLQQIDQAKFANVKVQGNDPGDERRFTFVTQAVISENEHGAIEVRAPEQGGYRLIAIAVEKGTRVKKGDPLLLLDNSDIDTQQLVTDELASLKVQLAKAEWAVPTRKRLVKQREAAIRAGIADKERQLTEMSRRTSLRVVPATVSGRVTYARGAQINVVDSNDVLVRIDPE